MGVPGPLKEMVIVTKVEGWGLRRPKAQLKEKNTFPDLTEYCGLSFHHLELDHVWSPWLQPDAVIKLFTTRQFCNHQKNFLKDTARIEF